MNIEQVMEQMPILSITDQPQDNWASDTGRNTNSAKFTGTFIGFVTQLKVEFGRLNQTQMTSLKNMVQKSTFNIRYQSSDTGNWVTELFYGTTIPAKKTDIEGKYNSFSLTFTGVNLRQ